MGGASFGRDKRLLASAEFKAVFDNAVVRVSHKHLLLLAKPNSLAFSRIGLVVAKKSIRRAVARNRIKRVVRETFRQGKTVPVALDIVFLARRGLDILPAQAQTEVLNQSWQRLSEKRQKVTTS